MKHRLARAALVVVVLRGATLTTACGGSDPQSDSSPSLEAGATSSDGGVLESGAPDGGGALEPLCNAEGFCWENPVPHGVFARDLWATGPNDVWVVGYPGELLHYDGARWTKTNLPTFASLSSVWASSATDVWVGGYEYSDEGRTLLFHFDGAAWTLRYSAGADAGANAFRGVRDLWGAGPHDVWAVGDNGGILHFDGTSWAPQQSGTQARLENVSGSSATDVWTVPFLHFDGAAWQSVDAGPLADQYITTMWPAGPNDVWFPVDRHTDDDGGGPGTTTMSMVHFDGTHWTEQARPGTASISGMWGSSPNDIWAAGISSSVGGEVGSVLHFDGQSWKNAPFDDVPAAMVVAGSSATDVWFHDRPTASLLHYDGAHVSRSPQRAVTHALLYSVWGVTADDVWAVGGEKGAGRIVHRSTHGWDLVDVGAVAVLRDVDGSSASNVWAVGNKGTIVHFDGHAWSTATAGVTTDFEHVWTSGPADVWAAGEAREDGGGQHAVALHYDGKTWTDVTPTDLVGVADIAGTGPDDVWLVGYGRDAIRHFDGVSWSVVSDVPRTDYGAAAIAALGKKDVWIGTAHFDGAIWSSVPADPQVAVTSIWARGPNDVWTMSAMGDVGHYDGTRFRHVSTTGGSSAMTGVGGDLFIVGMYGQIMHKAL